ncbi:glycosyltransferase family A protein [Actinacidiphila sp. ITFR-21]|uniref:glycosyltransferase family A protein n=1 Tax=Actinacidiphila sp. ITFR-21 TaxID=3075199 RepID=UPI00288C1358|nr:glycosyltransferase family A protein [Streptomyces sp. ITFR-21]WNI19931.1 glycosyltransferase family A protein [Streptomyces sp. ITFR-21]
MTRPVFTTAVTVITPTRLAATRLPFLRELYSSLLVQAPTAWQWVLALDGADPGRVPAEIADAPRVLVLALPAVGAAAARNLALNESTGVYCAFCDDDVLPADSLARRYRRAQETGHGWIAGRSADLLPDGSTRLEPALPPGVYQPGDVWAAWTSPETSRPPVGHTTLLVRTELARAAGGQGGLTTGEDYLYCLQVTGRSPGEIIPEICYLVRRHPGQMTAASGYDDGPLEQRGRRFAWLHGRALYSSTRTGEDDLLTGRQLTLIPGQRPDRTQADATTCGRAQ